MLTNWNSGSVGQQSGVRYTALQRSISHYSMISVKCDVPSKRYKPHGVKDPQFEVTCNNTHYWINMRNKIYNKSHAHKDVDIS